MNPVFLISEEVSRRNAQRKAAESFIARNLDLTEPARMISGVAISVRQGEESRVKHSPEGVRAVYPIPMLLNHDWSQPIGRVLSATPYGGELVFRAEILNASDPWFRWIWDRIIARELPCVSIGRNPNPHATFVDDEDLSTIVEWPLDEISVCECGADPAARIQRAWTKERIVYVDARQTETLHWTAA